MNYEPLSNLSLQKSNALVSAKYKSSLVENQIMAIALTRIEVNAGDINAPITARLYPSELKRLIGDPTNIYKTLKRVSKTMTGHTMFIEDGKGNFKAFAVVNNADYIDGTFTVEFNKNLREHILGLEKNYTSFELAILTRFKNNSSFRLYELLKSHIYKSRKDVNGGRVDLEFNISELRFMIGLANSDDQGVKNTMATMGNHIDWDILYSKLDKKDRKYEKWFDFQRYVIIPAQKELEEKSNIRFEYEGLREGHKMGRIAFYIYPNKAKDSQVIDERKEFIEERKRDGRQFQLPRDLPEWIDIYDEYVGHNDMSPEDIDLLIQKAHFNKELLVNAIIAADKQPELNNYIGWIISYITSGGYKTTVTIDGSKEKAEIITDLINKAHSSETKQRVWEMTKKKDDFNEFLKYMEETKGISFDEIELCFDPDTAVSEYIEWRKKIAF